MKNAVGREIPEEILKATGKEPFQGNNYKNGVPFRRQGPIIRPVMDNEHSKLVKDIHEALVKCRAHSGMTVSFHHHFREGDLIVCMVMKEIQKMGLKNITLAATSLGKAHDDLVPMIEDGTITRIEASGVRGKIGRAISEGKLKGLAIMRSHGGRVRSLVTGETKVDIAFIGAPTSDDYGNLRGIGGKTNCGVLSYSHVDGDCAEYVVAITDCLVPFPNFPAHISMTKVDYVCVVDAIGIPESERLNCPFTEKIVSSFPYISISIALSAPSFNPACEGASSLFQTMTQSLPLASLNFVESTELPISILPSATAPVISRL